MPDPKVFIDTNVILYSHDQKSLEKLERSRHWLHELSLRQIAVANLQVMNEVTDLLLRRKWLASAQETFTAVAKLSVLGDRALNREEVERARLLHLRYRYSWWDCLLLAAAINLGCTHFLSEDLQDGQTIEGLTILDPFAHTPNQIFPSS